MKRQEQQHDQQRYELLGMYPVAEDLALAKVDHLINEYPGTTYFHDTYGGMNMFFEKFDKLTMLVDEGGSRRELTKAFDDARFYASYMKSVDFPDSESGFLGTVHDLRESFAGELIFQEPIVREVEERVLSGLERAVTHQNFPLEVAEVGARIGHYSVGLLSGVHKELYGAMTNHDSQTGMHWISPDMERSRLEMEIAEAWVSNLAGSAVMSSGGDLYWQRRGLSVRDEDGEFDDLNWRMNGFICQAVAQDLLSETPRINYAASGVESLIQWQDVAEIYPHENLIPRMALSLFGVADMEVLFNGYFIGSNQDLHDGVDRGEQVLDQLLTQLYEIGGDTLLDLHSDAEYALQAQDVGLLKVIIGQSEALSADLTQRIADYYDDRQEFRDAA